MKKFLVSTANTWLYDEGDNLIATGITNLDTSIETTVQQQAVQAGQGNKKQYVYYHSAEMNLTITDAQFNIDYIGLNVGSPVVIGSNVYDQETVTLAAGAGTVVGLPLALNNVFYGWVTYKDGTTERVQFTGGTNQSFVVSDPTYNGDVCVRYYTRNTSAKEVTVWADIIPSTVKIVMEAMLGSSEATTNKIGVVQIIVPKASMTGAFTLSMTPDGVASTPLNATALAFSESDQGGCVAGREVYARIIEKLDNVNWYDEVVALAVVGSDPMVILPAATKKLDIRALTGTSSFMPEYKDLTFAASGVTITPDGIVTGVVGGGQVVITITGKPSISYTLDILDS